MENKGIICLDLNIIPDGWYIDKIVENKSKFLYVLHDCEFDFTTSKIHTDEVVNGGFNNGPTTTPSNMDLNIVFKSYSRILIPALMENSSKKDAYILDYKLKNEILLNEKKDHNNVLKI